jgi:two-component system LytT family response regulator
MERIKRRVHESRDAGVSNLNALGSEPAELTASPPKTGDFWNWIVVKARDSTRLVMVESIDWIQGAGVYVTLHAGKDEFLYRGGLAALGGRLDPKQFIRIHKSSLVNVKSIARLERQSHGEFRVVLKDGTNLRLSRCYREHFQKTVGQPL